MINWLIVADYALQLVPLAIWIVCATYGIMALAALLDWLFNYSKK